MSLYTYGKGRKGGRWDFTRMRGKETGELRGGSEGVCAYVWEGRGQYRGMRGEEKSVMLSRDSD